MNDGRDARPKDIVLKGTGDLGRNVLKKRAPCGDIDHLQAATHPQNGLAITQRPLEQLRFNPIARRIGPAAERMPLFSVAQGIDIHAAGDEQSVKMSVNGLQGVQIACEQRDDPRHRPQLGQHPDIAMLNDPGRQLIGTRLRVFSCNANHRKDLQDIAPSGRLSFAWHCLTDAVAVLTERQGETGVRQAVAPPKFLIGPSASLSLVSVQVVNTSPTRELVTLWHC